MQTLTLDTQHLKQWSSKLYTLNKPTPLRNPKRVAINEALAYELGITSEQLSASEFVDFVNGSFIPKGSQPYATAYAGYQFGYFVPNLGDGRVIHLGSLGDTHLQLKGAGQTAYSRDGDGRAVLRSSIREFLMSEMMAGLGIPTHRALALITSDTLVKREGMEQGAILLRASTSWIRFGSFEFAYLGKDKQKNVQRLADFVINESYPHLQDETNRYANLYYEIVDRTLEMIARWQSVGFMHGVINSDNMSIEGLTLDYGPFAMMELFDRKAICNLSDYEGRYSFENQPYMAQWNLNVLAKAFSVIINGKALIAYNNLFIGRYKQRYFELMREKLGLYSSQTEDRRLITDLLKILEQEQIDYTPFFYHLSQSDTQSLIAQGGEALQDWLTRYQHRLSHEPLNDIERQRKMRQINPKYVLKNEMLQEAIERAEQGDYALIHEFLLLAQNPYGEHPKFEHYAKFAENKVTFRCSCSS